MGRRLGWRILAAIIFGSACARLVGTPRAEVQAPVGTWEFSADNEAAKCLISLRPELSAGGRHQLTVPLPCLKSFPVLGPVETWNLVDGDHLAFAGRSGQAVLEFAAASGAYLAAGPNGVTYRLAAPHGAADQDPPLAGHGNKPQTPSPMAEMPAANGQANAAGRYLVLREGGRDTGCMLTLDPKGTSRGKGRASLAPGCRDQDIVIFDPAGWEIIDGRLILIARKGHKVHFDAQSDGSWAKDATEGKALSLKKL